MGSKGGGSTTTSSSSGPPQEVLDAYNSLIKQGQQVAATPYTPYTGQLTAGLTGTQQSGINTINNAVGTAQPYINQAADYANQSAQSIAGDLPQYNSANIQQYQDPYTQQVINATQANLNQNDAVQQQQLLGKAISSGASPFGGDRAGVAAGELARQQSLANGQTIAGLQSQGFQNAQNEFNTQQQTQLQAQNADASRQAQASYLLGGLGTQAQTAGLQGGAAQLAAGSAEQQTQQNVLNAQYQQFQQQQAYPFATTGWLGNLVEGIGSNSGGEGTTTNRSSVPILGLASGGVPKVAGGGNPYGDVSWINSQPLSMGRGPGSAPRAEAIPQNQGLSMLGSGAQGLAKGLGTGTTGIPGNVSDLGSSMPWLNGTGAMGSGADMGSAMPWLAGGAGDVVDLGASMPWLASAGAADAGAGLAAAGGAGSAGLGDLALLAFAKEGGSIGKYANGGDIDDTQNIDMSGYDPTTQPITDSFQVASEPISNLGDTENDAMAQAYNELDDKPTIDHSSDTTKILYPHEEDASKRVLDTGLPSPQGSIPTANTSQTYVKDNTGSLAVPIIAGLAGTLASRNLGTGVLTGLGAYSNQQVAQRQQDQQDLLNRRADLQQQYLQQKDKSLNDYRQQEIDVRNKALADQADYRKQMMDRGKHQILPVTTMDENGKPVQSAVDYNSVTGEYKPVDITPTPKGGAATPPGMSPVVAKEQAKTDAKRAQAYQSNKPVIDNIMSSLDVIEPNLGNFTTGAGGDIRSAGNKALMIASDLPGINNFIPDSVKDSAATKGTASANIDKETSALAMEMAKFQPSPGNRSSVLALKTMLANKPGVNLPPETNANRVAGIRSEVMNYDLSEQLAQQYRENSPYGMTDSTVDKLDSALKTMYPTKTVDPKTGKVTFLPDNVAAIRQAIPDAVKNPQKYLTGQTPIPQSTTQQPAQVAPPAAQRTVGQVYSTPKGNLKWTGTGWVN